MTSIVFLHDHTHRQFSIVFFTLAHTTDVTFLSLVHIVVDDTVGILWVNYTARGPP